MEEGGREWQIVSWHHRDIDIDISLRRGYSTGTYYD